MKAVVHHFKNYYILKRFFVTSMCECYSPRAILALLLLVVVVILLLLFPSFRLRVR